MLHGPPFRTYATAPLMAVVAALSQGGSYAGGSYAGGSYAGGSYAGGMAAPLHVPLRFIALHYVDLLTT